MALSVRWTPWRPLCEKGGAGWLSVVCVLSRLACIGGLNLCYITTPRSTI